MTNLELESLIFEKNMPTNGLQQKKGCCIYYTLSNFDSKL